MKRKNCQTIINNNFNIESLTQHLDKNTLLIIKSCWDQHVPEVKIIYDEEITVVEIMDSNCAV